MKDYDHKDSWCSKRCDNANSSLNLDKIVGLGVQQPPKKQVVKKRDKKETAATIVTSYTGFSEERMELEFH